MLTDALVSELDAFLLELNHASAGVILPLFRGDHGIENKSAKGDYDSGHRRRQGQGGGDPPAHFQALSCTMA